VSKITCVKLKLFWDAYVLKMATTCNNMNYFCVASMWYQCSCKQLFFSAISTKLKYLMECTCTFVILKLFIFQVSAVIHVWKETSKEGDTSVWYAMTMTSVLLAMNREPQHHGTLQITQCSVFLQEMILVIYLQSFKYGEVFTRKCKNQYHIYLVYKLFEVKFRIQLTTI